MATKFSYREGGSSKMSARIFFAASACSPIGLKVERERGSERERDRASKRARDIMSAKMFSIFVSSGFSACNGIQGSGVPGGYMGLLEIKDTCRLEGGPRILGLAPQ